MAEALRQENVVEVIKRESRHLRGDLQDQLDNEYQNVSNESEQLLKFHGIYAQDNRDSRRERAQKGEPLEFIFMVRVAIPGGRLTTDQWLALDKVASQVADGTIRLTTRQAVQFHGVSKADLRKLARELHEHLMTSFGACGDVVRNIVTCPGLQTSEAEGQFAEVTARLAMSLKPLTSAHWEIFVNGDRAASLEETQEQEFYQSTYLPRKFKIAIAHPNENCVDVYAQDLGLIPTTHTELGHGFVVVVGGGLGRSYAHPDTFAQLAVPLTFVTLDEVDEVIAAVLATFRDLGDRSDRRRARMKYLIADVGFPVFRKEVERRLGRELRDAIALPGFVEGDDHLGWTALPNSQHQVGIRVGAGRVRDVSGGPLLSSALRKIANEFDVLFHITAQQDLLISGIAETDRKLVNEILFSHGVRPANELGPVERNALACPALPTCGQALAESERRLPEIVGLLEDQMALQGLSDRSLQLRMTGCPNGCARPAVAEVGIVGRTKSTYDLYLGGGARGDRLASLYREKLRLEQIPEAVAPLLERWRSEGREDESFGDFFVRVNPQ